MTWFISSRGRCPLFGSEPTRPRRLLTSSRADICRRFSRRGPLSPSLRVSERASRGRGYRERDEGRSCFGAGALSRDRIRFVRGVRERESRGWCFCISGGARLDIRGWEVEHCDWVTVMWCTESTVGTWLLPPLPLSELSLSHYPRLLHLADGALPSSRDLAAGYTHCLLWPLPPVVFVRERERERECVGEGMF